MNIYEIYTKHPTTGETGWDIQWVRCKPEHIEQFPLFDEIITTNDFPCINSDPSIIIDFDPEKIQ